MGKKAVEFFRRLCYNREEEPLQPPARNGAGARRKETAMETKVDLSRFTQAHRRDYETALREIRGGRKQSHWMWYIFPQAVGLGYSSTSQFYGIRSLEEARAFLEDPYLGGHLREISRALLELETNDPRQVFGPPDDWKLRSCMTLFGAVSGEGSLFHRVLDKYFGGRPDNRTLGLLSKGPGSRN